MLDELAAVVSRHCHGLWRDTEVPRQNIVAIDEPLANIDVRYETMACFVVDGAKLAMAGDHGWLTERGDMFLSTVGMPVTATFERTPYRAVSLLLDGGPLADLLLELDGTGATAAPETDRLLTVPMTPELVDAVTRWVRLLDTPADIAPLAPRVETEILYRLLAGPLGPTLRQLAMTDSPVSRVRRAAAWITAHYTERITVEDIAEQAHMSTATLHRHFKAATGMSPLRFQKHLRLQEARRRLVAGDVTAAMVAEAVGYVSASQFNREYHRAYGLPPAQDAARLRGNLVRRPIP